MNTPRKPLLIVISAPSGAGKTTLCERLLKEHPGIVYSVSCTTRPRRGNEIDGQDYYFLDEDEFRRRVEHGDFVEHALVHGFRYGTLKETVLTAMEQGRSVVMDIDVQGARQIRDYVASLAPDDPLRQGFVDIFVSPPSLDALQTRLVKRGEDPEEVIHTRLRNAEAEIADKGLYKYEVVNDDLDRGYAQLRHCLEQEWRNDD